MSKLLTDEYPLIILPKLAVGLRDCLKAYASDAAAFVQQIHYWATKGCGVLDENGRRWIYNTYEQWLEQFPWLTEYAFRKIKSLLLGMGIIEAKALGDCRRDRTLHYAINYSHQLIAAFFTDKSTDAAVDQSTDAVDDCATNNTEITPENNSDIKAEEILEKYEDKLKTYSIYVHSWDGENVIPNPRMQSVLRVLTKIPRRRAECAIEAFLEYLRQDKPVKDKYQLLATALSQGWS